MKKAASTLSAAELTEAFLNAHDELRDVRWYTLLLFNAFEQTMRLYLMWRLSCKEDELPNAVSNSPNLVFELVLAGAPDLRETAKKFKQVRNAVAHGFHENRYEPLLRTFVEHASNKRWSTVPDNQLRLLANAVFQLSFEVGVRMQELAARLEVPYPELTSEIHFARQFPAQRAKEKSKR